jgi:arginyl-tRNA synthetase
MSDDLRDLDGLAASLAATLRALLAEAGTPAADLPPVELALPARPEHGDLTTNAAMMTAKRAGRPPRELAEALGERWMAGPGAALCERVEVAGPGFLNLFLNDAWYRGALASMLEAGADYGRGSLPEARRLKVNVEFVSVNPTGPLHVGHARYASYGDALCRIFAFVGHDVTREFYVNDYGTQMLRFGQSLAARYGQRLGIDAPVPEDGYRGEYLLELADELIAAAGDRYRDAVAAAAPDMSVLAPAVVTELKVWGRDAILGQFRATLERLRVPFDVWTPESTLFIGEDEHRGYEGEVGKALADLDREDLLYDEDGAVWLKTTQYGDDKDRVLIRSSGEHTYFLSDIAYHRDKMDRGFAHMIDIWGADHHGYVPRMKAAFTALPPHEPDRLELIIGQMVNLLESGEAKRMSKRRGDIVTVDDLIDAIGVDAARFLLVGRSHDTTLELDIDLAVQQSSNNSVYYVQYAHARICSILRNLEDSGARPAREAGPAGEALPAVSVDAHERSLLRALARFPDVLVSAADQRTPNRLHTYLGELAAEFHVFYRNCRVLTDDPGVTAFRAALCDATRGTLATGLGLLGVSAPESM